MTSYSSKVLEHPITDPHVAADYFRAKLECGTDSADVYNDIVNESGEFIVIDTRSRESYLKGHIPTAISFPTESAIAGLDRNKTYVVYCDGIGCNGSTKGAFRLSSLGFKAKELVGGFDWWSRRDGYPIVEGEEPGSLPTPQTSAELACDC
jgi:rhodanese-related sulfurtransferase